MAPIAAALYAIRMLARQRYLADPDVPEHWLYHYNARTHQRTECECAKVL